MDFTLSGQVSTAFSHVSDDSTDPSTSSSGFGQFGEASNRFRMNGSSELATGGTVGIQFELGAENGAGLAHLRHANVQYGGGFGKITLGQGSEAGDGSAGSGIGTNVFGIRTGAYQQPAGYFGSLNAGGRQDMIRYDSPAVGPMTAAVSAANVGGADHIGSSIGIKQAVGGTEFAGKLSTHNIGDGGRSIIGAAVGVKLPAGLIITGAWAKARDLAGMTIPAVAAVPANYDHVNVAGAGIDHDDDVDTPNLVWENEVMRLQGLIDAGGASGASADDAAAGANAAKDLDALFDTFKCTPETPAARVGDGNTMHENCQERLRMAGMAGSAAVPTTTDPSYFQAEIGYNFGDTTIAATWYQSQDFMVNGSDGTAMGIGATHVLGNTGAKVFAAARKYDADDASGNTMVDATVFLVGTVVAF